ncbi:hypothetical protein PIB30_002373 [Stylosanthes scabra]|uniref:Uncharacterized protein n=1 Tax=Stylosanthes scabra TaxID=79078 RepID=A0ABU6V1T9_9FABA|nr:hypothetical protein [Stylosanthes scabra]
MGDGTIFLSQRNRDVLPCITPKLQHVHFATTTTIGSPPPVSLEIHQLDSLQQPKLGADWAHQVLYSPRNIGVVAGERFFES